MINKCNAFILDLQYVLATSLKMENTFLNLVLLGGTGAGKSASGNTILGWEAFESRESFTAVTEALAKKSETVDGFPVTVYDTPGLSDSDQSEEKIQKMINENVQNLQKYKLCLSVFLLVINTDRFTEKQRRIVKKIENLLGQKHLKRNWILFTRGDELEDENTCINEFINESEPLKKLTEKYDQRYHVFNNTNRGDGEQVKLLLRKILMTHIKDTMASRLDTDEVRIVLLGKTGVGKSASGNTIFGRAAFKTKESYESDTKVCQRESSEVNGRLVTVIDTPGLFDTELTNEEIREEITNCISMILPGPHVFLLLIPLGRFTKEEQESVKIIQEMFGEISLMFTMVLFTRGDDLKSKTIDQHLGKPGSEIRNLIETCGNRVHVFNNNQTEDRTQVYELLEKIDNMVEENGGSFYSCKMFRQMERERQEQQMKILTDRVREREEEIKTLEEEKESMERMMEEERQNQEEERKRREEELKKEEEKQRNIQDQMRREQERFRQEIEEMKREQEQWERQKDSQKVKKISETDPSLQATAYSKLTTEYSKWSWSLRRAMMETENKLHNQIRNEIIHDVEETDLHKELKKTSEEVEKSMSELFEKDKDKDITIQWKTSFEIKIKELQENIVRETKRKLNEILQQRDLKKKIEAQRTEHENTLYEKSRELALKLEYKTNREKILKKEFDLLWHRMKINIRDAVIRDIDIMRDAKKLISDIQCVQVEEWKESKDIFTVSSYHHYIQFKKMKHFINAMKKLVGHGLSKEEEDEISSLVSDVAVETDRMIQSFNISEMGYNISCIQQLTGYIKKRVTDHQERQKKYELKNEFFIDLVLSTCKRANKMISDQHRLFREANDPSLYLDKNKKEYYSVFQKYCHGATSTVIFGEIICQKLKEPIEQSVYKKTARDLADEMRSNCKSLNGNRSNLEKHILKTLAEEEDFDKYMDYIHKPRDHFKSFIRDEVSRYISDKFSVSVLPKMKENIELLQQKIITAAHESTEHVQDNSGDVGLWLKNFTQRLSDELVFSERDLSGVKHDGVEDFKLLQDVMGQELPVIMSNICSRFNTKTFPSKLDFKFRPDELLIDHLCQGCWAQCPFCGATCTNTIEDHDGDHSVHIHRVPGINGTCFINTQNLCHETCQNLMAHDLNCRTPAGNLARKEIKIAGPESAVWNITPDRSTLPYWKWFVCIFKKDLETHYSKTFDGNRKIPQDWKQISKLEAIESLAQYV